MVRMWKTAGWSAACLAAVAEAWPVWAGCPCQSGSARMVSQSMPPAPMPQGVPLPPTPQFGPNGIDHNLPEAPTPAPMPAPVRSAPPMMSAPYTPMPASPTPALNAPSYSLNPMAEPLSDSQPFGSPAMPPGANMGVDRFGMSPPPGTLGQTYKQRSRLIEDDKHPRFAAVDVFLPEEVDVTGRGMKSKWTGKVWRLEVKDPLLPGVPHIYAIKAERKSKDGEVLSTDVRWVRLIPGRIVDLSF